MAQISPDAEAVLIAILQKSNADPEEKRQACEDLYLSYYSALYQDALSSGAPVEDAEDQAHDTLLRAYQRINAYKPYTDGPLEAWLKQLE